MPIAVPTTIFPVSEQFLNVAREGAATPGVGVIGTQTTPVTSFQPDDKPIWLPDEAWRASMAGIFDVLQGPIWTETQFGGPAYGDTVGNLLYNILGDNVATGTAASPATTLTSGIAAGVTSLPVAAGASFTVGMLIQIDTGVNAEIVKVLSAVALTITLATTTPTRFAHLTSVAVTNTTTPYVNTFGLLNGGNGQPPSHTFVQRTQIPGAAGNQAAMYAYGCLSKLTLTGNASGLLTYSATMSSYSYQTATSVPTASVSAIRATPNWRSLVGIAGPASGGTLISDIMEWEIEINRVVQPIATADGQQQPYVIARGKLTASTKLNFQPALDASALTFMLNNTQPQLQILYNNGLSGAQQVIYTINAQQNAIETAKLTENSPLFGYDTTGVCVANTTNGATANSGGYSPISISIQNSTGIY
jgi:hypothetical protein